VGEFIFSLWKFSKKVRQYIKKSKATNILNKSKFSRSILSKIYGKTKINRKNLYEKFKYLLLDCDDKKSVKKRFTT
tara:strand:+ start:343 stop:570 length:228 start_codon:yes stop_codon:yes gene_type:complete